LLLVFQFQQKTMQIKLLVTPLICSTLCGYTINKITEISNCALVFTQDLVWLALWVSNVRILYIEELIALGFTYDIIGEAISVACHAESSGAPGRIHITEETKEKLNSQKFMFEEKKDPMDTKRRGKYKTYYLLTKIDETSSPNAPL
jgi:hypothetical protein